MQDVDVAIVGENPPATTDLIVSKLKRRPIPILNPHIYRPHMVYLSRVKRQAGDAFWALPKCDESYTGSLDYTTFWGSILAGLQNCKDFFSLYTLCCNLNLPDLDRRGCCNVRLTSDRMCEVAFDFLPDDVVIQNPFPILTG